MRLKEYCGEKNYILSLEFVMIIQLFYPDGQHHRLWLSAAILLTQRESALHADSFLTSLAGFSEFPSPQCTRSTHRRSVLVLFTPAS